jgi:phosphonoacetaldehyde hydrolase
MSTVLKAVIFDWAGTMIDFGCMAPVNALIDAFGKYNVAITAIQAREDMGRAKRDHVAALLAKPAIAARWREVTGADPDLTAIDQIYDDLVPLMVDAAARSSKLIDGAVRLVENLRARGIKIGSGTGYTREMMEAIIPCAAAQGYAPDIIVCAHETKSGRPAPLMTWKALVELDAWPAHCCVKVDDAVVGITEGRLAGCWTIGLAASGNGLGLTVEELSHLDEATRREKISASANMLKAAGADYVVETIADVSDVLNDIETRISLGARPITP